MAHRPTLRHWMALTVKVLEIGGVDDAVCPSVYFTAPSTPNVLVLPTDMNRRQRREKIVATTDTDIL